MSYICEEDVMNIIDKEITTLLEEGDNSGWGALCRLKERLIKELNMRGEE